MKSRIEWSVMKNHIQNATLLAAATMFVSLPMFHYQFRHLTAAVFRAQPSVQRAYYLALSQSFVVFCLAFLSALIGFIYTERLRLPGFGKPADIRVWLPVGLIAGLIFTPISYLIFDRGVIRSIPEIYPASLLWTLVVTAGRALSQEVIVRFGLLTIGVYLWDRWGRKGRPWPAIAAISAFGAAGSYLMMSRLEMVSRLSPSQIMIMLVLSFLMQWILCEVYIRKGFLAAVCVHLGLAVKYVIIAWVFRT